MRLKTIIGLVTVLITASLAWTHFNSTRLMDEFKALTGKLSDSISGEHGLHFIAAKPSKAL